MGLGLTTKILDILQNELKDHPFLAKYIFARPNEFVTMDKYQGGDGKEYLTIVVTDEFEICHLSKLFWYNNPNKFIYEIWADD